MSKFTDYLRNKALKALGIAPYNISIDKVAAVQSATEAHWEAARSAIISLNAITRSSGDTDEISKK